MGIKYAEGRKAWGYCERCGLKYFLKDLEYDGQITGLQVCRSCWDPEHPQEAIPDTQDPVTLLDPTGDLDKAVANAPIASPINLYAELFASWDAPSISVDGQQATVSYGGGKPPLGVSFAWVGDHAGLEFTADGNTVTVGLV